MIATYAAVLAVCAVSLTLGQAAVALCGARRWSWLSPAVGLALLCAICWATVRLPGDGSISAVVVVALTAAALFRLRAGVERGGEALRLGLPVGVAALLAASLPFAAEGHFGILGTGFNPDMSQHLLATDRLAHGESSQLLVQGYPLGPHAIVVALNKGLGVGVVQGFDGMTMAAAVLAPLTALALFAGRSPDGASEGASPRYGGIGPLGSRWACAAAALVLGLPYLVASYYAQGAFKEVVQALFALAFVLSLRESTRAWRHLTLRYVPAALLAIGSVYVYSFPGLIWLAAIAATWGVAEWVSVKAAWVDFPSVAGGGAGGTAPEEASAAAGGGGSPAPTGPATRRASSLGPSSLRAASLAVLVFLVGTLPELGRMIDFHSFETFDPNGPGLGNLFGQISPFTALGIWPSGDFRLAPGDGAAPAFAYHLGAAFATALLILGIRRAWRAGERPVLAGLIAVVALYLAARLGGTPYTAAKALEIAAPILTLTILLQLADQDAPSAGGAAVGVPHSAGREAPEHMGDAAATGPAVTRAGESPAPTGPAGRRASSLAPLPVALVVYLLAAGACSLLALANAPVGPTSYSPALTHLRSLLGGSSTLVLAPEKLLAEEQGERYIAWELRGGRVCIEPESAAGGAPPAGIRFFVTTGPATGPPFSRLDLRRQAGPYVVWERREAPTGPGPCPLIAVRQARSGLR